MPKMLKAFTLIALLSSAAPVYADANADLKTLVDAYWADTLKESPIFASSLGVDTYAREVGDFSLAASDRRAATAAAFLAKLNAIPQDQLDAASKVEAGILARSLNSTIEGNRFGQRAINFTTYSSWHQSFAGMANNLPFRTKADYESYNARLAQYAAVNDQNIDVANVAIRGKYTQPCETLEGFEATVTGLIVADPKKARHFGPYTRAKPESLTDRRVRYVGRRSGENNRDCRLSRFAQAARLVCKKLQTGLRQSPRRVGPAGRCGLL